MAGIAAGVFRQRGADSATRRDYVHGPDQSWTEYVDRGPLPYEREGIRVSEKADAEQKWDLRINSPHRSRVRLQDRTLRPTESDVIDRALDRVDRADAPQHPDALRRENRRVGRNYGYGLNALAGQRASRLQDAKQPKNGNENAVSENRLVAIKIARNDRAQKRAKTARRNGPVIVRTITE